MPVSLSTPHEGQLFRIRDDIAGGASLMLFKDGKLYQFDDAMLKQLSGGVTGPTFGVWATAASKGLAERLGVEEASFSKLPLFNLGDIHAAIPSLRQSEIGALTPELITSVLPNQPEFIRQGPVTNVLPTPVPGAGAGLSVFGPPAPVPPKLPVAPSKDAFSVRGRDVLMNGVVVATAPTEEAAKAMAKASAERVRGTFGGKKLIFGQGEPNRPGYQRPSFSSYGGILIGGVSESNPYKDVLTGGFRDLIAWQKSDANPARGLAAKYGHRQGWQQLLTPEERQAVIWEQEILKNHPENTRMRFGHPAPSTDPNYNAQPSAQRPRATLIHPKTKKRIAVDVGGEEAQRLFGEGYELETSFGVGAKSGRVIPADQYPSATVVFPGGKRKVVETEAEANAAFAKGAVLEEEAPDVPATLVNPKTGERRRIDTSEEADALFKEGFELEKKPGVGIRSGAIPKGGLPRGEEVGEEEEEEEEEEAPPPEGEKKPVTSTEEIRRRLEEEEVKQRETDRKLLDGDIAADQRQALELQRLQRDVEMKRLRDELVPKEAPKLPSLVSAREQAVKDAGLEGLETQLTKVDQQIRDAEQALLLGVSKEGERLAPMTLITGRQAALKEQASIGFNALVRKRQSLVDQIQSKERAIATIMELTQQDHTNARAAYNDAFEQNYRVQQAFTQERQETRLERQEARLERSEAAQEAARIRDDARASYTTLYNIFSASGKSVADLDDAQRVEFMRLEAKAGMPTGFFETFATVKPKANVLATTTGTDAEGNEIVSVVYMDPVTGKVGTVETIKTGAVGKREAFQELDTFTNAAGQRVSVVWNPKTGERKSMVLGQAKAEGGAAVPSWQELDTYVDQDGNRISVIWNPKTQESKEVLLGKAQQERPLEDKQRDAQILLEGAADSSGGSIVEGALEEKNVPTFRHPLKGETKFVLKKGRTAQDVFNEIRGKTELSAQDIFDILRTYPDVDWSDIEGFKK